MFPRLAASLEMTWGQLSSICSSSTRSGSHSRHFMPLCPTSVAPVMT